MEQIVSVEDALKELHEKKEDEVKQFHNPKKVGKKINNMQIILRQLLVVLLAALALLLINLMMPDLYEQIKEYLNIRFGVMP